MATTICKTTITIGEAPNQYTLKHIPCKKLPPHILLSDTNFLTRIIVGMGKDKWTLISKGKKGALPKIEFDFQENLGLVNEEPVIQFESES